MVIQTDNGQTEAQTDNGLFVTDMKTLIDNSWAILTGKGGNLTKIIQELDNLL